MEEIINNIMQSPENTNPNVLRSQLQNIGSSSSGSRVEVIEATVSAGDTTPIVTVPLAIDTLVMKLKSGALIRASYLGLPDPYFADFFGFPAMVSKIPGSSDIVTDIRLFMFSNEGLLQYSILDTTADSVTFISMNQ